MDTVRPDVLIVGSGPIGCTFARQIHEQHPDSEILMLEAGPQLTSIPGVHVRNIADPDDRVLAQVRSQGPNYTASDIEQASKLAGVPPTGAFARPGTAYLDADAARRGADDTLTVAAISTDVGGMGVHWTCACPHPAGREIPDFIAASDWQRALERAQTLLRVTQNAFPPSIPGEATRRALSNVFDQEPADGREVQPMPLACQPRSDGSIYWSGTDVILGPLATIHPRPFTCTHIPFAASSSSRKSACRTRSPSISRPGSNGRSSHERSSSPAMGCARRSCSGLPASGPRPSVATSTTIFR